MAETQKPSSSDSYCDAIKSRLTDTYTETPSDSDLEVYSGDDSNLSTPVKKMPNPVENKVEPTENEKPPQKNLFNSGISWKQNPYFNYVDQTFMLLLFWWDLVIYDSYFFVDDKTWEEYLGSEEDPKSSIMIRFPDGQREAKKIPCSSKFMVRPIV